MYKLIRPILFWFDAEDGQHFMAWFGHWLGRSPFLTLVRSIYYQDHPELHTTVAGLEFRSPLGVAAGFDKPADLLPVLNALGFGSVEVGTVTPEPQPGNPRPRLFHLPKDKALINRMGFNSEGMVSFVKKLSDKPKGLILGINIVKNRVTPNEEAVTDYEKVFTAVADYADYIAVNVSSPNTPGLRQLQNKDLLRTILGALQELNRTRVRPVPIFLKIAPDLDEVQLDDIISVVLETSITGIITINTSISRAGLTTDPAVIAAIGEGGLSGPVMKNHANKMIAYLYKNLRESVPIIGVGGIFSAHDAYDKIRAGASLVQMYTGIVYEGPRVAKKINAGLVKLLKRDGFKTIAEAVGVDSK